MLLSYWAECKIPLSLLVKTEELSDSALGELLWLLFPHALGVLVSPSSAARRSRKN